ESFEDEGIARYLNQHYIAIKVDRERRPDVDATFMQAVRLLTGKGGWPLTVWLTPEGRPFFGGTYYPPRAGERGARVGFLELLQRAKDAYDSDPGGVLEASNRVTADITRAAQTRAGSELPGDAMLRAAAESYRKRFDHAFGGLQTRRTKFPSSLPIRFLLRYHRRSGDQQYLDMATKTLDAMRSGGIYDHVGGGFHRYSTDPRWLVPHFEKMLYDNARLVVAYLEGYQATGEQRFADTAKDILAYVEREMVSPEGGFYSATDADSLNPEGEREEGAFFVWSKAEIEAIVGAAAPLVVAYFAVTAGGNFEGHNVLNTPRPLTAVASELGIEPEQARAQLEGARKALFAARAKRPAPGLDDKILTGWNGLMISAYARAARAIPDSPGYLAVARKAADFILANLLVDGRLKRSHAGGRAEVDAVLEDYAFLIAGLLDLFEASAQPRYLKAAVELDQVLAKHYEDPEGGFYRTADDAETVIVRTRPLDDRALPSGNSVHALNLLRLYELTTTASYLERADRGLTLLSGELAQAPTKASQLLLAIDFRSDIAKEVVVVSTDGQPGELGAVLARSFVPNGVFVSTAPNRPRLAAVVPLVEHKVPIKGKPTAYVCEQQRCELPTSDPAVLAKQLAKLRPIETASPPSDRPGKGGPTR
ncbi:MAG: thioredoxin domain-containing protein, partial [Deltaproteobacteria bacterium]|nr:thioredoxin domain-containing protein [Deltaproteobacteria bacterium]